MTKYREYFDQMVKLNKELFKQFSQINHQYQITPTKWQKDLNQIGTKVLGVIREWEGKLCRQSEVGGYGNYTTNLAEKFQGEVRRHFPAIDNIGLITQSLPPVKDIFKLKKIKLS